MKYAAYIPVKIFSDASIKEACAEAVKIAGQFNYPVSFNYAKVSLLAYPGSNPEKLYDNFIKAKKSASIIKQAVAYPEPKKNTTA